MSDVFIIELDKHTVKLLDEKYNELFSVFSNKSNYDERMKNSFAEALKTFIAKLFIPIEQRDEQED